MPIYSPTGYLDITNAILRTSNIDAQGITAQTIQIGDIEIIPTYGLEHTANVGNTVSNVVQFTNETTSLVTSGNVAVGRDLTVTGNVTVSDDLTVTGNVTVSDDLTVTGNVEIGGSLTVGGTKTFVVTVQQVNTVNKYFINGVDRPVLQLHQYQTYIFDLSDSSLVGSPGHPFIFSETADGDAYDTGITTTGTPGNAGAKKTFVVPAGAPTTLYYYCTQHVGMGDTVNIGTVTDLVVSGTRGTTLGGGTTAQRSVYPLLGTIRYNTTTGFMEGYTATGWGSIATPPTIQTISPTSVAFVSVTTQVFTVTGAFFDAQSTLQLLGGDNTLYVVTDFVFTNSGSIGFKMGTLASGQAANRPYKVVVTNGAGLSVTSTTTIGFTGLSWTSPAAGATLATFNTSVSANNTELAATDDVGGSGVTFSVPAFNLPSGLSLNGSTGAITGIIGAAGTTSVTFRVTDNVSGATLDRTFSIVGAAELYPFSTHTFTNAGVTGRTGPTITDLTDTYTPAWTDNTNYLNVTNQGIQEWTVPKTGTYEIEVYGARGRGCIATYDTGYYGKGARMKGRFSLTKSQIVKIVVGQEGILGGLNENNYGGGGGGGSFVFTGTTPLIIAGGGGGGAIINVGSPNLLSETIGIDGQITTAATLFNYDSSKSGTFGSWYVADNGANGGHWTSQSSSGYSTSTTWGARGWTDAIGGSPTFNGGIAPNSASYGGNGGFGCGGGVKDHPGGGGGGYSGGASANYAIFESPSNYLRRTGGGGGGSYNNGSSQSNSPGVRDGHGQVIINLL
jgi:hypothetical protein